MKIAPYSIRGTCLLLLILCLLRPAIGEAQILEPPNIADFPKYYVCARATEAIVIDGNLDDSAWRAAPWSNRFLDIEGKSKPPPRFSTRVKMLWDDRYLYIGADLQEPDIWATLAKRDTIIFYDNDFEVFLDPNGDNIEYIEMEMNALNTVWDLLLPVPYRDGGRGNTNFNIEGLQTAVHLHGTMSDARDRDTGWTIEIAMPWSAFRQYAHQKLPPAVGDQWRINFSRVEWQVVREGNGYRKIAGVPEANWVWSPQGVIDMHRPERWGYIQYSRNSDESFRPDPSWNARVFLMKIYYAERAYHEHHGAWAATFGELGIEPSGEFAGMAELRISSQGYQSTVLLASPDGALQRWHIEQDSHIWHD